MTYIKFQVTLLKVNLFKFYLRNLTLNVVTLIPFSTSSSTTLGLAFKQHKFYL